MKTYSEEQVLQFLAMFDNMTNNGRNRLTDDQLKKWLDVVNADIEQIDKAKKEKYIK